VAVAQAGPLGPTPYLEADDSPFDGLDFDYYHLEDFEDHLLNVPGVTGSAGGVASVVFGPGIHDSVDGDDGSIDGSGLGGDDYFSSPGSAGVRFDFDESALGGLPTHAGVVWTDGEGTVSFQAFDENGALLGTIGPVSEAGVFPDGSFNGETGEDRFFGFTNEGGISAILLSNSGGGIELDHLQFGLAGEGDGGGGDGGGPSPIPLPAAVWPGLAMLGGLFTSGRIRRWRRGG
jgi:hypothetical protein